MNTYSMTNLNAATVNGAALSQRLDLYNHSPTGFAWGYCGSGAAQLALAILANECGDEIAMQHYHNFKFDIVATHDGNGDWSITSDEIAKWFADNEELDIPGFLRQQRGSASLQGVSILAGLALLVAVGLSAFGIGNGSVFDDDETILKKCQGRIALAVKDDHPAVLKVIVANVGLITHGERIKFCIGSVSVIDEGSPQRQMADRYVLITKQGKDVAVESITEILYRQMHGTQSYRILAGIPLDAKFREGE